MVSSETGAERSGSSMRVRVGLSVCLGNSWSLCGEEAPDCHFISSSEQTTESSGRKTATTHKEGQFQAPAARINAEERSRLESICDDTIMSDFFEERATPGRTSARGGETRI